MQTWTSFTPVHASCFTVCLIFCVFLFPDNSPRFIAFNIIKISSTDSAYQLSPRGSNWGSGYLGLVREENFWLSQSFKSDNYNTFFYFDAFPLLFFYVWRGEHPDNGFGYKAKNSLTLKQCLKDPCKLLGTPLCETSYFHCQEYECIQRSEPCKKYCKLLNTCWSINKIKYDGGIVLQSSISS